LPPTQSLDQNRLLSLIDATAYAAVAPQLEATKLPKGAVLIEAGVPFTHAHFFNSGIGSIVVGAIDSRSIEAGLFGREGMSGFVCLLDVDQCAQTTMVQVEGEGYRISIEALRIACDQIAFASQNNHAVCPCFAHAGILYNAFKQHAAD